MDYGNIISLVVGFSLVVIVHELGHFLAAKHVGIKVEQFALGFGQALFSWRKGIGFRAGSTEKEYARRLKEGAEAASMGDTEYRFNWIPLGGYVKMMGQDDTKPGMVVDDPRSYTSKSVGQRMLVISAGVIMNIIFAFVAFMVVFMMGMKVQAPVVGAVVPMSPAQMAVDEAGRPAPLEVGDTVLTINGRPQFDFGKIQLNTALAGAGEPLKVQIKRVDGSVQNVLVTPIQVGVGGMRLLQIGIGPSPLLEGPKLTSKRLQEEYKAMAKEAKDVAPGERITAVEGQSVEPTDYYKLDAAVQTSEGRPVTVTVAGPSGTREAKIESNLVPLFGDGELNFAGMVPRAKVSVLTQPSAVSGKVQPDDVIVEIAVNGDARPDPSVDEVMTRGLKAGADGQKVRLKVLRDGNVLTFDDLKPNILLERGYGLGMGLTPEQSLAVVGATIKDSPAANIPVGSQIRAVNGAKVASWPDVLRALRAAKAGERVEIEASLGGASPEKYPVKLNESDVRGLASMRFSPDAVLSIWTIVRQTSNPLLAAWWGVTETRDSLLQVYVTLRRLVEGSVPFKGLMGPVGMAQFGSKVAAEGWDRLLWFLAIISANLAVVNFLPIPVVDGGHFMFLTIEKLQGKPVSERKMVVAQYIGLAMILTLFVAVTYQDILRLITAH